MHITDALDFIKEDIRQYIDSVSKELLTPVNKFVIETHLEFIVQKYKQMGINMDTLIVKAIYNEDMVNVLVTTTDDPMLQGLTIPKPIVH